MKKRKRSTPHSFEQRISEARDRLLEKASQLPSGPEREKLEQKLSQLDTAARVTLRGNGNRG
jgi:hypothetical protein